MTDEDAPPLEGAQLANENKENDDTPRVAAKKFKRKEKKPFDPLSDDPIKFKIVDFEHALTPEEKAAKKAAKLAALKGPKKSKKQKSQENAPSTEPSTTEGALTEGEDEAGEPEMEKTKRQSKKSKKGDSEGESEIESTKSQSRKSKKGDSEGETEIESTKRQSKKSKKGDSECETEIERKTKDKPKKEEKEFDEVDSKGKKSKKGKKVVDEGEGADVETSENSKKVKKKSEKTAELEREKKSPELVPNGTISENSSMKSKEKGKSKHHKKRKQKDFEEEEEENELDDGDWTWESYSISVDVLEEVFQEKEEKKVEVVEDKKRKKKKKVKKEDEVEQIQVVESLDELTKMRQLAAAALVPMVFEEAVEEVAEEEAKKEKKRKVVKKQKPMTAKVQVDKSKEEKIIPPEGKQKKMSKKAKAALAAEMARQAKIQAEIDAKLAAEAERLRVIEERKANIEKEKREIIEQKLRVEQLGNSQHLFNSVKERFIKKAIQDKESNEWNQYLKCDGLPNPYYCGAMSTYLHRWEQIMDRISVDEAVSRTDEVLQLLDLLNLLIDEPIKVSKDTIKNWKWIHVLFREHQQKCLDILTYRMLRDIQRNLHRLNLAKADYTKVGKNIIFCLWVMVEMPPSRPNPRKPALPRVILNFPEMSFHVTFPKSINCKCMGVRAMYLRYDHLSSLCSSFDAPPVPQEYLNDLNAFNVEEWRSKLFYKYEAYRKYQLKRPAAHDPDEEETPRLAKIDPKADTIPAVPYRKLEVTASQYMFQEEDELCKRIRDNLRIYVEDEVINLRKYCILGGTFYLDLYHHPPQPKDMVLFIMTVTKLQVPTCLAEVPFYETYQPPLPTESNVILEPEQMEEEMRYIEEQLEKLILITLTLPPQILWLDTPMVCQWDKEKKLWSKADIHDFKHVEEKSFVTFRAGRFGCFGIAVNRYVNLPYQAWEIKPEADGSVTFQITAAILLLEFNIKGNLICLVDLQNATTNALQELIGVYYRLPKLIRLLQEGGVDVFPAFDAFCYIEGTCEKQWQMESHLYNCMAQLSVCYNFMWSRWNHTANRRTAVMQMREYNPKKSRQVPFSALMVTPFKSLLIECTEISSEFTEVPVEGMLFYSDLIHLMKGISSMPIKTKVFNASGPLVLTVAKLLQATRVLSFSS